MDTQKNKKMIVYDMVFGVILIAISLFFIYESAVMTRPKTWLTAPGLPPLVIFISLGCMGFSLLISSVKARGLQFFKEKWRYAEKQRQPVRDLIKSKTIFLIAVFFIYFILLTRLLPFELSTTLYLFVMFKYFWGKSLSVTLITSVIIAIAFSYIFSNVFKVMLPGIAWRDLWFF